MLKIKIMDRFVDDEKDDGDDNYCINPAFLLSFFPICVSYTDTILTDTHYAWT